MTASLRIEGSATWSVCSISTKCTQHTARINDNIVRVREWTGSKRVYWQVYDANGRLRDSGFTDALLKAMGAGAQSAMGATS